MSNSSSLGVSLSEIAVSKSAKKSMSPEQEISAYRHDVKKSVLIGLCAIVVELLLYFSGLMK